MSATERNPRLGYLIASWWPLGEDVLGKDEPVNPGADRKYMPNFILRYPRKWIIYHYATVAGLYGIIEQNAVWASHVRYMNDVEEVVHGKQLAIDTLGKLATKVKFGSFADILRETAEKLSQGILRDHFVASFSQVDDDLTQWRAYGKDQGVCIGFDLSAPDSHLSLYWVDTAVAIYRMRDKVGFIVFWVGKYFEQFVKDIEFYGGHLPDWVRAGYSKSLSEKLQFEFIRFKHESFASEQEIRFVIANGENNRYRPCRYRVRGNVLIPYHLTSDRIWRQKDGSIIDAPKVPMSSVTIGPMIGQDLCAQSIRDYLTSRGYDPGIVKLSRIPYRSH